MTFLLLFSDLVDCRRKKKLRSSEDVDDEPIREAPEYGKVWYPDRKRWGHFIGREPNAVVAFIDNDPAGNQYSATMKTVINLIDMSKLNVVVAQKDNLEQIFEDQDITEIPTIKFYKSGQKRWTTTYDGPITAKSIAKWAMDQVRELDEWDKDEDDSFE